ncbi:MAG: hypothetical protein J6Q13_03335 [Clostridia bacterium]|nr:hypothetical protein [Clostridia bacterium]
MLNLIVGPSSHNSAAEKFTKRIVKYLKTEQVEYSVYFSQTFENIKENVKELLSFGENEFVIVGDDVVISSVISSIKDLNKVKIGIVPTSKKDDFASYFGISTNPIQAIKNILAKNTSNVDIMIVNDMPVINNVIIGASVEVFHQFSQYKMKNFISEKVATAKYGNNFSGVELSLETKGKIKKENVFELVVANGGLSKGKLVSPLSNMQDGLFNVTYSIVSHKNSKKKFVKMFNKGTHIYNDETKQHWLNNLKITNADKKIKALIDGKIHNLEQLNISIVEGALKIYK